MTKKERRRRREKEGTSAFLNRQPHVDLGEWPVALEFSRIFVDFQQQIRLEIEIEDAVIPSGEMKKRCAETISMNTKVSTRRKSKNKPFRVCLIKASNERHRGPAEEVEERFIFKKKTKQNNNK